MDKAFLQTVAVSDKCELTLAKAAQEKAQSQHVKDHAAKMIQDHTQTTNELKELAKQKNVDLKMDLPEHKQAVIKEITSKSGEEFEKAYMMHETPAHRMALATFRNGADFAKDPEVKAFAQKHLPTIQQHLAMVEQGGHSQHMTTSSGATQQTEATRNARTGSAANQPVQPDGRAGAGSPEGQVRAQ